MSADYFRKQAATCLYLARQCFDLGVTERLRIMAEDFLAKADEIERDKLVPACAMCRNGSPGSDRG